MRPLRSLLTSISCLLGALSPAFAEEIPTSPDPNLQIQQFADSDLIKHPTGITFTAEGKLLVVESHTHFAPEGYEGPETDQIIWLEDNDGDGTADRRHVFFGRRSAQSAALHSRSQRTQTKHRGALENQVCLDRVSIIYNWN